MTQHTDSNGANEHLFSVSGQLQYRQDPPYLYYKFNVPAGANKVGLRLSFSSPTIAQIPMALYDADGIRGIVVNEPVDGDSRDELWVATNTASKGGLPGEIRSGEWTAQLFIRRLAQNADFTLEAYAELGPAPVPIRLEPTEPVVLNSTPGWYKGELHSHSDHSTGRTSFGDVVKAAMEAGYDFLSVTDHMTVSHWSEIPTYENNGKTILLKAAEIAGNYGHANVHGARGWIDPFVDGLDWRMNQVADAIHSQGGLFCVNHPMSGNLGWRYDDFDWSRADLFEIFCTPEGPNNNLQPVVWDRHLSMGEKLVGVGSTDSHHPYREPLWNFGQIVNWVYADELSEKGIIEGLRRGIVYTSRGPQLRFTAHDHDGLSVDMWESLPLTGKAVEFHVRIKDAPSSSLFVIKNGYPFRDFEVSAHESGWQTITFEDKPARPSYYRLELHRRVKSSIYTGIAWRDFETMLFLSNPIWVGLDRIR